MLKSSLLTLLLATIGFAHAGTNVDMTITPLGTPKFDFDDGGQARLESLQANFGINHDINQRHNIGVNLQLARETWHFDQNPWKVSEPWKQLERVTFSVPYRYSSQNAWFYSATFDASNSKEKNADTKESWIYGMNASVAHAFSPTLVLGVGAGVYRQLEKTQGFPFLIIDWKITPSLTLANPFTVGPVGPAGLELSWALTPQFEVGAGAAMRQFQYRLAKNNPLAPDGVLEEQYAPVFLHAAYKIQPNWRFDAYTGVAAGGKFTILDSNGNELNNEKAKKIPFFGFAINGRF
ncbi:hypothetical protein HA050_05300 [Iodobacter sp. HSC-16F04]|uniref:DUF6268 domain-containing protein n=1 Tax=Iodobacter violaceini TaxID=3044271 RepID=A0ABX0KP24_9NEIS|nr:DUF6268 family outer membrane beta-barrel protein [Iodobacter violacea]NHQ85532.1 hypothetical protein [Iodobacter violacea]